MTQMELLDLVEELSPGFKNLGILDDPQMIEEGVQHFAKLLLSISIKRR